MLCDRVIAALLIVTLAQGCDRGGPSEPPPPSPPATTASPTRPAAAEPPQVSPEPQTRPESPANDAPVATQPSSESPPPASEPAGGAVPAFEPLVDAVVGEWARLTAMEGREVLYEVTDVRAATVTMRVTTFQQGKPLGSPALREDFRNVDPVAVAVAAVKATRTTGRVGVELAGRTWDATFFEDQWTDEGVQYVRRTWVSPEAPVFGILKMELYGDGTPEAALELTAGGKKE